MNILIAGASAGLGRALAQEAAARGHNLLLCATGRRDLAALASDLRLRFDVQTEFVSGDFCSREERICIVQAAQAWLPLDAILLPMGFSSADDNGSLDDASSLRILEVNFFAQVSLITALWDRLASRSPACIVGFGSVAAIRGRRRNIVYAAAKRSLESYFESLRAMAEGSNICIQLYRLGYMKTQQTFGKKLLLPVVSPERVAEMVFRRLGKGGDNRSYPEWWAWIAAVLQHLPWFLYKRLDF
jgi:short-subunit dehydrogenase